LSNGHDEPDTAEAPLVPEALIPEVEQPARRAPAPIWLSALVALMVIALVAGGAWLAAWGGDRWGTEAMTRTAVAAAEAFIRGDAAALVTLSDARQAAKLTPAVRASMAASGLQATFAPPVFRADTASVVAAVGSRPGTLVATPDPNGAAVVTFRVRGALGTTSGTVDLERTWRGWEIAGFDVKPLTSPPAGP
jgi:hypothetical protein